MPSKSARTRKSTNRKPTSRAVRDRSSPHPPIPTQNPVQMASPDQLQQIDPQLFALENTQAGEGMDNSITVNSSVERQFSPFSDAYESPSAPPADTGVLSTHNLCLQEFAIGVLKLQKHAQSRSVVMNGVD
jgi:hypothetical protein